MSAPAKTRISPAKLALAVRRLRGEKQDLDLIASDPIAIIGMGCRYPGGAGSPEEFWKALHEGRNCVGEVPAGRWKDAAALKPHMLRGGYLQEIEGFDAGYFGISPREAQQMDPQQRILLEVAWEALWDAGIEPASLAGKDTGVFVAIYNSDYGRLHFRDTSLLTAHAGTGSAHSVAAGRLSFLLNVNGPNLAIDSACSSSLVATHLACQSLRAQECGLAIAASSNLKLLSDEVLVFSKWGMLASDGKCKTFDAGADGFVPGEGSGVLILKRLSDALQDGDRVRAVIRGTAVNHGGRATVLTAPNGLAQEAVLRAALRNAMLEPGDISYIETHGTGTSLGDPIEIEAVGSVYGHAGADAPPCVLGALKTNVGHMEASSGIGGLIKTVLCMEHEEIPKNLHFHSLNPEISLAGSRLKIATENIPWKRGGRPRVAGVSSFGLGGTNGHIIVEEAPLLPTRDAANGGRKIPLAAHAWQRQKFWLAEPSGAKAVGKQSIPAAMPVEYVHPLLGRRVESPFVHGALFESDLNTTAIPYLAEHRLGDRALLPFAAFLEMASAGIRLAGKSSGDAVRNFMMREPGFISSSPCRVQVLVGDGSVEIASESGSGWTTNAKGSLQPQKAEAARIDLAVLRARCDREISAEDIYLNLEKTGLRYGASFRPIQSAWSGKAESLAHLRLPEKMIEEAGKYGLHPALLDGCLQTVGVARGTANDDLFLPIAVDMFELRRPGVAEVWVHAKVGSSSDETVSADLTIADADGAIVAQLKGFTAKRTDVKFVESLANAPDAANDALTYAMVWRASPLVPSANSKRAGERWVLIEGGAGSLSVLANSLIGQGASCDIIRDGELSHAAFDGASLTGIVYDARSIASTHKATWEYPEKNAVEFILEFAKYLTASKAKVPRVWIVSSSAVAVLPQEDVAPEQAPLWGMMRTLALEYPETSPVSIDAGRWDARSNGLPEIEDMLAAEIASGGEEPLVSFRNGTRYVPRWMHPVASDDSAKKLQIGSSGLLEDLRFDAAVRQEPEPDQVEIRVRAAGLNFRDVITALGMLPVRYPTPGGECAGTIVRVGANVKKWKIGDEVLGFAPGSFQGFVNAPANSVTRKPAAMTFADAAGVPIAFLTAYYGLNRLAKLSAGQTILIHAAAGGLGLAAVQLAMRAGARVFATAGSDEKRAYLKRLGVERVFDSRSLSFREEVLAATGGAGVDVVLNSLAGDFIRASFDVTARNGCFLEVGKRGIWSAAEVAALKKNIRYFAFDLGEVAVAKPTLIAEMLSELMAWFSSGELHPLPTALYAFEDATEAFRTMAQARHIGKIVLGLDSGEDRASLRDLVSDGTVLITGGAGALGIETARWLAAHGSRNIVLAGRSGSGGAEHPIVAELRAQGVEITIERADVAAPDQLAALLEKVRATGPPLRVVVHAAGVVQDSVLGKESWESYRATTAPKILGALNLNRLTEKDPIRLMIFYSSAASTLGSPGQGSYAAGNGFMDALAHHRASRGLRTLSVNWGTWASAGMAARLSPEQTARWTRHGIKPMEAAAALSACESAIESGQTQVAILDVNWDRFLSDRRDARLFSELQTKGGRKEEPHPAYSESAAKQEAGVLEQLQSALEADRKMILAAHAKVCARRVLGLEELAAIEDSVPLQDIGLDSLMALELRNELAQSLGLTLPAGLLFDYPAVEQVSEHLLGLLAQSAKSIGAEDRSAAALDSMSDEEAERLLIEELDRVEREKIDA